MINENKIYRQLQLHLDKFPIGFPATKSGIEIKILKHLFTPLQSKIALCLGLASVPAKRVRKRLSKDFNIEMPLKDITEILDRMFMSGSIRRTNDNNKYSYANAMIVIGMFEYQVDHLTKEFIENMNQYFDEAFNEELFRSKLPQLKTIPHSKAIIPEHNIAIYDDIRKFVTNTKDKINVANCICKQGEEILGNPCKQTDDIEVCFIFGETSYEDRGQSRIISKEECLNILDQSEEKGLVLQPGNTQEPFCLCCCCGCCCGVLTNAKKFPKPADMVASNYYADINKEMCSGCGICLKRCQMDALIKTGKKVDVNKDKCIGCGLCITKCPKKAARLLKKPTLTVPPRNTALLYLSILMDKIGKKKMVLKMAKLLFGMRL